MIIRIDRSDVYIDDITFSFYSYDEESDAHGWQASWDEEEEKSLAGIKIEMKYEDGGQDVQLVRTVFIPAAQSIVDENEDEDEEAGEESEV